MPTFSIVTLLRPSQRATRARVRSSACRGYVVELDPAAGKRPIMLENLLGETVHFKSLQRVQQALKRRGVQDAVLVQHHACEELGSLAVPERKEIGVALLG